MHSRDQIVEFCENAEIEVLLLPESFDKALIGLSVKFNEYSVVYDTKSCIDILMSDDGMSYEEAVEFFEFNISGAYMGKNTPTFLLDIR